MKRIAIVAIGCLLFGYGLGNAQSEYRIYGPGTRSCANWTNESTNVSFFEQSWVFGFITGAGWSLTKVSLKQTDTNEIIAWVNSYCKAHPLATIATAAGSLAAAMAIEQ